ncbi:MAG TPA: TlpA disulfide reductase family protein [Blastocatellia bacterium]|nr:TlpA disulfide reductase family protein [Blastocatellia bacterium]
MSKFFFPSTRNALKACFSVLALSALLAVSALALGSDDVPELPAADGSSYTPEILVKMIDKNELKLSSLRGKVVLLDFFWTKCVHCQEHAPHVVELYQKYQNRGFVILGLATDLQSTGDEKTSTTDVKDFVKKYKLPYPVGFSNLEAVAYFTDSHNRGVPQMVLFGPDGKMVLRHIGWSEQVAKEINDAISAQLDKLGPAAVTPAKAAPVKPGSKASVKPGPRPAARV